MSSKQKILQKQLHRYNKIYSEYIKLSSEELKTIFQNNYNLITLKLQNPEKYKNQKKLSNTDLQALVKAAEFVLQKEKQQLIDTKIEELKTNDNTNK